MPFFVPTLIRPGGGPPSLGRFQSSRSTVLPFDSVVTPVGVDGHTEAAAQGTAVTSALPTGLIDLDLVLIEVSHGSGGPPGTTITTPAGWNLLSNVDDGSAKAPVFWRFFLTGDAAPSFTLGTSRSWCTRSTAFRNVDTLHPFGPFDADYRQVPQASSGTYTSATITPGEDGALLVTCFGGKVAAGIFQSISTAVGWLPTGTISQSTIAAVTNVWAHFQYRPLPVMAPISEVVTITDAAVGQAHILALRSTGLPTPPMRFGAVGTALHPGEGPSLSARFWQTPRSTDVPSGTQISLADTGTAADDLTVAVAIPLTDAGVADDPLTVTAAVPLTDAATAADTLQASDISPVTATRSVLLHPGRGPSNVARFWQTPRSTDITVGTPVALTDTGSAADTLTVTATADLTDTGVATDAIAVAVATPLAEGAAAADALAIVAAVPLADAASGDDQLAVQVAAMAIAAAMISTGFHPGRGPTWARFHKTARSTEITVGALPADERRWEGAGSSRDTHDAIGGQFATIEASGASLSIHEGDDTTSSNHDSASGTTSTWEGG